MHTFERFEELFDVRRVRRRPTHGVLQRPDDHGQQPTRILHRLDVVFVCRVRQQTVRVQHHRLVLTRRQAKKRACRLSLLHMREDRRLADHVDQKLHRRLHHQRRQTRR